MVTGKSRLTGCPPLEKAVTKVTGRSNWMLLENVSWLQRIDSNEIVFVYSTFSFLLVAKARFIILAI